MRLLVRLRSNTHHAVATAWRCHSDVTSHQDDTCYYSCLVIPVCVMNTGLCRIQGMSLFIDHDGTAWKHFFGWLSQSADLCGGHSIDATAECAKI